MSIFSRLFSKKQTDLYKDPSFLAATQWNIGTTHNMTNYITEGYMRNPVVAACVNKVATAIKSVDLVLYTVKKDGDKEVITTHPMLKLLQRPNILQGYGSFAEEFITNYMITGNAFILRTGNNKMPAELMVLPTNSVKPRVSEGGVLLGYEYTRKQGDVTFYPFDNISGTSDILHFKECNPLDKFNGLSRLQSAALNVDQFNAAQYWNNSMFNNGARPSGVISKKDKDGVTQPLTQEQYNRLKEEVRVSFSGKDNAGKPLLLEGGLEWQEMSLSPKDMEFLEGSLSHARYICTALGVPPQVIGVKGQDTFNNFEQANLSFWGDTVLPLLKDMLDELNRWLVPMYSDKSIELGFNEEDIPSLEAKRRDRAERLAKMDFVTDNEKRAAVGVEDIASGDVLLKPANLIPADSLIALTGDINGQEE
jgi:HK97 family phage portal protein